MNKKSIRVLSKILPAALLIITLSSCEKEKNGIYVADRYEGNALPGLKIYVYYSSAVDLAAPDDSVFTDSEGFAELASVHPINVWHQSEDYFTYGYSSPESSDTMYLSKKAT